MEKGRETNYYEKMMIKVNKRRQEMPDQLKKRSLLRHCECIQDDMMFVDEADMEILAILSSTQTDNSYDEEEEEFYFERSSCPPLME